jgi:hypothetical protein
VRAVAHNVALGAPHRILLRYRVENSPPRRRTPHNWIVEQLQDAGMRTAQLDQIVRQKDPGLLKAVEPF